MPTPEPDPREPDDPDSLIDGWELHRRGYQPTDAVPEPDRPPGGPAGRGAADRAGAPEAGPRPSDG
ncbi:hypothetical protein [Allonocardiopsis opalescens]|uniref:Uncharacterized protein n=1 Tax=Allonocardiopsis opalescens TaxID=1144618 RepID=A0A2T0Q1X6_9ACTN|nr:hypothetical protein [Allonocardiopsis opalescens]PRX97779.1 hypothetical protein CLV72_105129 [Allonocardiopsis opalescens]